MKGGRQNGLLIHGYPTMGSGYNGCKNFCFIMAAVERKAIAPEPWVELTMVLAVLFSGVSIAVLAPRMFKTELGTPDYITAAVPFFFFLILLEVFLLRSTKLRTDGGRYHFDDTWSSLAAGTAQRMWVIAIEKIITKYFLTHITYKLIWTHYAIYRFSLDSLSSWFAITLLIDFLYYWTHRLGHQIAFLWAGHSVHHSSEHYNLSTALRQSIFQHIYESFSFIPVALFFPPQLHAIYASWNTVYQFWVHTTCIRTLGPIEWVFMTASHHRVHHDRRVHKNYGGIFIIWDKIFGTFLDEKTGIPTGDDIEVCAFGTMNVVNSWSDIALQTEVWRACLAKARNASSIWGALKAFWIGPGYYTTTMPRSLHGVSAEGRIRKRSTTTAFAKAYVIVHSIIPGLFGYYLMGLNPLHLSALFYCPLVVITFALQGLLLDGNAFGAQLEGIRCLLFTVILARHEMLPILCNFPTFPITVLAALYSASALACLRIPEAVLAAPSDQKKSI